MLRIDEIIAPYIIRVEIIENKGHFISIREIGQLITEILNHTESKTIDGTEYYSKDSIVEKVRGLEVEELIKKWY